MNNALDTLKKEIRRELISRRNELKEDERKSHDKAILDKVISLPLYREADTVLVYASYKGEVDTYALMERCLNDGKKLACPKCRIDKGEGLLDFYFISSTDELTPGYKGIPEPDDEKAGPLTGKDLEDALVIIPMVGYDGELNRLGYGGGFYDRFLAPIKGLKKMGLAYSCQEYDSLPAGEYDIKLDMIINEL